MLWLVPFCLAAPPDDEALVKQYVRDNANATFKPPSGMLKYPYLVPGGVYDQMWDWDALFMGVALADLGAIPYLAGTMMNFLDHTNVSTGEVQGCLKPDGSTGAIYHAKPVVIQGAWLAVKHGYSVESFLPFKAQMQVV